ncbi:hypothetical protein AB0N65_08780 [Paenarthrobacter sp. NPDC089322]|uniref:hypothetical protein n=1 Tax=Paenarthrobacter sp. NPDC089322 TaxID=3155065 RepID=UPI00343CADDD
MPDPHNQGAAKQPPRRYRLNVPHADEAVVAWMELQDNQSMSIRMLIRASIERFGYVDIVNRPVLPLPAPSQAPDVPAHEPTHGTRHMEAGPTAAPGQAPRGVRQQEVLQPSVAQVDVNDLFTQLRR